MAVSLRVGDAFVEQPDIQLLQALDPQAWCEEALSNQADLVLDLSLLPSGCRRAGYGMDEIVAAHLQETAVILPPLADEHSLDSGLHVVVDASRAGASVKDWNSPRPNSSHSCAPRMPSYASKNKINESP